VTFDVIVVGGGGAGLWTAEILAAFGMRVLLVEQAAQLASGPSGRNGGYVHGGGFHAAVVADESDALEVAARCRDGRDIIERRCPEAIYREAAPVHLFARGAAMAERAASRWAMADLDLRLCPRAEINRLYPELASGVVRLAARVRDFPIDYRILHQSLLARFLRLGGEVRVGTTFEPDEPGSGLLRSTEGVARVSARHIVYCAGAWSSRLCADRATAAGAALDFRLWKSHVIVAPRTTRFGFLFLDPGEISVMPQRDYALICQSQEDTPVDAPDYEIIPERLAEMRRKLTEVLPQAAHLAWTRPHACLKPSLTPSAGSRRSVNAVVERLSTNEILALPGKSTEAPLMAQLVLQNLLSAGDMPRIAPRPGDSPPPRPAQPFAPARQQSQRGRS
jgi:glycine/D-amino acid oxidase-like deaminating enzyme